MKRLRITDSGETYTAEVHLHSCLQSDGWKEDPHFLVGEWDDVIGEGAKIILKNVYGKEYDLIELNNGGQIRPLFLAKITKMKFNPGDKLRKEGEDFIFVDLGEHYGYRYVVVNLVSGAMQYSFREKEAAESFFLKSEGWEKIF